MSGNVFTSDKVVQVGIVVKDIEKTSAAYAPAFDMEKPKWFWTGDYEAARTEFRGAASEARAKLAFFRFANLEIELIEPDEKPSTWREFLETKGEGMHHLAFITKGMRDQIGRAEAAGMPLVQKGEYTGGRYAYCDASDALKMVVEFLEND